MKCKNCGYENAENANYCINCGSKIDNSNELKVKTEVFDRTQCKTYENLKKVLSIVCIVLFFISLFSVFGKYVSYNTNVKISIWDGTFVGYFMNWGSVFSGIQPGSYRSITLIYVLITSITLLINVGVVFTCSIIGIKKAFSDIKEHTLEAFKYIVIVFCSYLVTIIILFMCETTGNFNTGYVNFSIGGTVSFLAALIIIYLLFVFIVKLVFSFKNNQRSLFIRRLLMIFSFFLMIIMLFCYKDMFLVISQRSSQSPTISYGFIAWLNDLFVTITKMSANTSPMIAVFVLSIFIFCFFLTLISLTVSLLIYMCKFLCFDDDIQRRFFIPVLAFQITMLIISVMMLILSNIIVTVMNREYSISLSHSFVGPLIINILSSGFIVASTIIVQSYREKVLNK